MADIRTALITGAMGGIGMAVARALGGQGCALILNDLGEASEHGKTCASLAEELGVPVAYDGADLSKRGEIEAMVTRAEARFGQIDILVNNAVIRHYHELTEISQLHQKSNN